MLSDAWALAIETLSWIELEGLSERLALTRAAKQLAVNDVNAIGLAHRLVWETSKQRNFIDFILNSVLSPKSITNFKLGLRAFLRLYTYETKIRNADLKRASNIAQIGRSILGWHELLEVEKTLGQLLSVDPNQALKGLGDEERTALLTAHPLWFVKYCFHLFGRHESLRFLESSNETAPTYIRINTLNGPEETLLRNMEADGIVLEKMQPLRHAYKVESKQPLIQTKSFKEGLFYIQDKASCLAAEVADPKAGMTVLDVCAAPGAKTTYLAQLMANRGTILSLDYSKRRMQVWNREIQRMGVNIATSIIADASTSLPIRLSADLVILDPPCTSTGTFRKLPSAKWRLTKKSILRMASFQWQMLETCADLVKEQGHLVYSTCSVAVEENEMLIEKLLKWHPDFKLIETRPRIGLPGLRELKKCQRLYPHIHDCNGFFIAKMQKEA